VVTAKSDINGPANSKTFFIMITKEVDRKLVGKKLKAIRKERNVTQKQLAEGTNYSKSYIGDIETERTQPSLKALMAIVEFLGAEPRDFFESQCCFERMISGEYGYCKTACEHLRECPLTINNIRRGENE